MFIWELQFTCTCERERIGRIICPNKYQKESETTRSLGFVGGGGVELVALSCA